MHRHHTPLRGTKATPRPKPGDPNYTAVNYEYAGRIGRVHEVVEVSGRSLAKVGFDDRRIVYYFLEDLELAGSQEGHRPDRGSIGGPAHESPRPTKPT